MKTLDELYANWYQGMVDEGTIKRRTLEEMRQRFEPIELFPDHFTVRDTATGAVFSVDFSEEYMQ